MRKDYTMGDSQPGVLINRVLTEKKCEMTGDGPLDIGGGIQS